MGLIVFILIFAMACNDNKAIKPPETIAEMVIATPGLENLVATQQRAGLVDVLNNAGTCTVLRLQMQLFQHSHRFKYLR